MAILLDRASLGRGIPGLSHLCSLQLLSLQRLYWQQAPHLEWKLQDPSRPGLSKPSCSVGQSKSQGHFGFRWRVRDTPALAGRSGQATRRQSVRPGKEGIWPFLAICCTRLQIPAPALISCVVLALGYASPPQSSPLSRGLMPVTETCAISVSYH